VKRTSLLAALALLSGGACRATATRVVANAISSSETSVYAQDGDPELVRAAVPFGLKTMEGLLADQPQHPGLLTALASGFTQYGYAFVQADADEAEMNGKSAAARALRERAKKLFLRARDYGLRGLELHHQGLGEKLRSARDLEPALAPLKKEDLPLVYWTAASWALAIAAAKEDMALVAELPVPGALMQRALAIDEAWDEGAIHEFLVTWEAAQGGAHGLTRAKEHFDRAVALSKGKKLGVLVSYAEVVSVARQDRAEFTNLLQQVIHADLDADVPHRLANVLAQRRAKLLLAHAEDLFA
jgi:TRAP transporter T-component